MKYMQSRNARLTQHALHWLILLAICLAPAMTADAQTLHALLIIMDADPDVGGAMQVNAREIEHFLTQVEKGTGLQVEEKTLLRSQNRARKTELTAWLDTREIAEGDVLFVYFSGKGRFTVPAEYIYLQDGGITHTELSKKVQSTGAGRLTLLITDRCDQVLEHTADSHRHTQATPALLEDLFKKHKGFLHLTSATGREPGWADANGGFFTHALLHAIQRETDTGRQGFTSWQDIFNGTRQQVTAAFEHARPNLADSLKADLRHREVQNQTPKAYELPTATGTSPGIVKPHLWELENPQANFTVGCKTNQKSYRIDELITFDIKVTYGAHILILNWNAGGDFGLLFPNKFEKDNFFLPGENYTLPPKGAQYEFFAMPPPGTERVKVLAFRNRADSDAIEQIMTATTEYGPGEKYAVEEQIVQSLQKMEPGDWAENRIAAAVKAPPADDDDASTSDNHDDVDSVRHPNPVNIVFFKEGEYGSYAYLAQLKAPHNQDAAEVDVHIFNAGLREKYSETLPKEWIIRQRTEPEEGWGHRSLMLNFYQDKRWIFTTGAVEYEAYYLLPERLNGDGAPIRGDREVGFGDVRIPIPISYENDDIDTQK